MQTSKDLQNELLQNNCAAFTHYCAGRPPRASSANRHYLFQPSILELLSHEFEMTFFVYRRLFQRNMCFVLL